MNLYNEPPATTRRRENRIVTTTSIYNDSSIWDDPDLDEDSMELNTIEIIISTTPIVNFTTTEIIEDDDDSIESDLSTTLPIENTTETIQYTSTSTTPIINIFPFFDPSLVIPPPPFSWMLNLIGNTTTTTIATTTTTITTPIITTTTLTTERSYEYCKDKQCQYGGRLTSDCLCICLPAYTGENCEIGRCALHKIS